MKKFVLAAIAALTLGMSVASAAPYVGDGSNSVPANTPTYSVAGG